MRFSQAGRSVLALVTHQIYQMKARDATHGR